MKINKLSVLLFLLTFVLQNGAFAQSEKWVLELIGDGKQVAITQKGGGTRYSTYPSYKLNGKLITGLDYAKPVLKKTALNDKLGKGSLVQVTYTDAKLPKIVQSFYMYNGVDYVLTDFTIESADAELASNYMAPVNIKTFPSVLPQGDNRALFIPFDNDKWIRFQSHPLGFDKLISYEATALFNNNSRKGFVIGSVEHDSWKSAAELTGGDKSNVKSLTFYGGAADTTTRDVIAHGSLTGKVIKSPKVLVGIFADWRMGMEKYGEVNAAIAPPRDWAGDVPFGWNSWGVLQFKLTYPKAMEVSDYFKNNLQNNNFGTGKTVVIGLDSGWDSFSEEELKAFVKKCEENGQIAGIYWTPFTDWGKNGDRTIKEAPQYKFKDAYAYANGKPQELDGAYAVDPTHPAAEERMKYISEKFRRCGFKYVKMDFMSHGSMEADKWYNADVKTGIQAYSYGMKLINKYFSDMYINLSIAPIFPSNYAQSRRIACDAWNKIKDTEYTLNAVSYGWWLDKIYRFNDADHVVLQEATEGENRARVTSGVITGLFIIGDDFSNGGPAESKEKAAKFLTNAEVNDVARGHSFKPVEGNGERSENQFTYTDGKGNTWLAVFNYTDKDMAVDIPFTRIGLSATGKYTVRDLWAKSDVTSYKNIAVPAKDVRLLKISKK